MKNKKLLVPAIILVVAVLAMAVYSAFSNVAKKPTVTEGEFPFSITYELNGETETISDVYKVYYDGNSGYLDSKSRNYIGEFGEKDEDNYYFYVLEEDDEGRIHLLTNLYPDYLMGDPQYDYFTYESFEPKIAYYDTDGVEYTDEETLSAHGVKLVSFEYPTPIENTLVFSHISYCNGEVVTPTLIIALLALIAMIIIARKEKGLKYGAAEIISLVLNCVIAAILAPFVAVLAILLDIQGGSAEFSRQLLYFIPAITLLCAAASVVLRRKGYGKKAFIPQIIGPALFAIDLILMAIIG